MAGTQGGNAGAIGCLGIIGIGVLIWAITSTGTFIDNMMHPAEHARHVAQTQKEELQEAQATLEAKRYQVRIDEWKAEHARLVAECRGGKEALDLPPKIFEELDRLCERDVSLKEAPYPMKDVPSTPVAGVMPADNAAAIVASDAAHAGPAPVGTCCDGEHRDGKATWVNTSAADSAASAAAAEATRASDRAGAPY